MVIPAHPLALTPRRRLDERHQRALTRYYLDAGAGGVAVAVHTTQFAIRKKGVDLLRPVLALASEEVDAYAKATGRPILKVAGVVGTTRQAVREATLARELGYHTVLVSLSALKQASNAELIAHCRAVARVLPLFGFYLQPAVGGRPLDVDFWRRFALIDNVVAIKIAPFNRYQTLDVVRGVVESGRADEIALYTGNDDNIVCDLLTPFAVRTGQTQVTVRIVGGLLGHWAVWTRKAVELLTRIRSLVKQGEPVPGDLLALGVQVTDCNSAFFDAAHGFAGCIVGIHEVLRRQGLLQGTWTLDPQERLSPRQKAEIDRVYAAYPHLNDDDFVRANLDKWLR
ncbi:MAG: dihydrodipicolinate synthase family protein [candidate division KSB1 bacterium]|nr:dihydrodipicolinate synthase family protein [candidate division KSB1 bacterium]MDZ7411978.1 dihydrodipicolinate synthase family protein [candidate division KSB1 bacterium]